MPPGMVLGHELVAFLETAEGAVPADARGRVRAAWSLTQPGGPGALRAHQLGAAGPREPEGCPRSHPLKSGGSALPGGLGDPLRS